MAKIRIMSDLHIEFGELGVPPTVADAVVLAGDVHVGAQAARWSLKLADRLGIPVVLVAGNHEHYNVARDPECCLPRNVELLRRAAAASGGSLVYLERQSAVVAGIRFVGCTLWTDFELFGDPAQWMGHAEIGMTDFHVINARPGERFTSNDARREFLAARRYLDEALAERCPMPTVVVTHHLPSSRSVTPRFRTHPLTPAYASNLDDLVERSGAALWVHGHTHDSVDYAIGATRVVCNPRGYCGYELNPRFNAALAIEVAGTGPKESA
jgi:predicted phosphodiesterase